MDIAENAPAECHGVRFEVPVPMPHLGSRFSYRATIDQTLTARVAVELMNDEVHRSGAFSISSKGVSYHGRDRFGLFARSRVEVRFMHSLPVLLPAGVMTLRPLEGDASGSAILLPSRPGMTVLADLFNMLVDSQTAAFGTYWTPHITPLDILSLEMIDWTEPEKPRSSGVLLGSPYLDKRLHFGKADFTSIDNARLSAIVSALPLLGWEEMATSALRDLELGRLVSSAMHLCLGKV